MVWCPDCDTLHLNRAFEGEAAGWHAAQGWGRQTHVGRLGGGAVVAGPPPTFTPIQMPHDDRVPHHRPQQDTWHWRELSVLPEAGACQATAAGLRVSTHNNPPKPSNLHNPLATPGHAGQRPPQYLHCCAPGWLSPTYQRDETPSSTHALRWS